jgi:uncharacterized protein (DUF433 family)
MKPVFGGKERDTVTNLQVSFLELVEIAVAVRFRKLDKIKLERIRRAHDFARRRLYVPFPFATLEFKTLGGHLIHEFEMEQPEPHAGMMAFDTDGQWALPISVQEEIEALEFEKDDPFAQRWFPFGRDVNVVVDPHLAAGRPVVAGTRVPITAIQERFNAGDSVRYLAKDYGLTISVVEELLRLVKAA